MIKVLVIIFITGLVFFRVIGFFFRLLSGSAVHQKQHRTRSYEQSKTNGHSSGKGEINIDYVPKGKKGDEFHGGEYVEFEEVD